MTLIQMSCVKHNLGITAGVQKDLTNTIMKTPSDVDRQTEEVKTTEKIRSIDVGKLRVNIRPATIKSNIFL